MIEVEKILLSQDSKAIQVYESDLKFNIEQTKSLLNRIASNYKFTSLEAMPNNPEDWILKMFLERNRKAREENEWRRVDLNEVTLPQDLHTLRSDLAQWKTFPHKDLVSYLIKGEDGFYSINNEMFEREIRRFTESQRVYAESPDQIERYYHSLNVLKAIEYQSKLSNIDLSTDSMKAGLLRNTLNSPFVEWKKYPSNSFAINADWILTGRI